MEDDRPVAPLGLVEHRAGELQDSGGHAALVAARVHEAFFVLVLDGGRGGRRLVQQVSAWKKEK